MICAPTLSKTAIFMLPIVSQMQPERCHVRSSNLFVTGAAFAGINYSIATAYTMIKMHFCELCQYCVIYNLN